MAEFAKKLDRIYKTRGEASNKDDNQDDEAATKNEAIIDFLDDDDWNPEAHEKLTEKLFGDGYYGAKTADDELDDPPDYGDDEEELREDYDNYQPRQVTMW